MVQLGLIASLDLFGLSSVFVDFERLGIRQAQTMDAHSGAAGLL